MTLSLLISPVLAQTATGDLTGRVLDAQGNVVAGAVVTATNAATGATRSTNTNDAGEYTITQLTPGVYEVPAEAKGFSRALQKGLEVNIGAKPTLNFELKPGGVTETVEVQGGAPLIETTRSEIGACVTPNEWKTATVNGLCNYRRSAGRTASGSLDTTTPAWAYRV